MTRYKSILKMQNEFHKAPAASQFVLQRFGLRDFWLARVDDDSSTDFEQQVGRATQPDFVYGVGFREIVKSASISPKSHPRKLQNKAALLAALAASMVAVVVILLVVPSQFKTGIESLVLGTKGSPESVGISVPIHKVEAPTCKEPQDLAIQADSYAKKPGWVISDQRIGGFRELRIFDECSNAEYQVLLYLDGKAWKAKSATPVGSHSQAY